jgi:hypothetical protein
MQSAPLFLTLSFGVKRFSVLFLTLSECAGLMFPPLERRVRVCLCDGCNFLGNIHVFPAVTAVEEEDEPWVFVNKVSSLDLLPQTL